MPGDSHLPIFNYDQQSAKEVIHKVDVLLKAGIGSDFDGLLEYEKAHQNRPTVVKHLEKVTRRDTPASASSDDDDARGEGAPDDHDQQHGQGGASGNR